MSDDNIVDLAGVLINLDPGEIEVSTPLGPTGFIDGIRYKGELRFDVNFVSEERLSFDVTIRPESVAKIPGGYAVTDKDKRVWKILYRGMRRSKGWRRHVRRTKMEKRRR